VAAQADATPTPTADAALRAQAEAWQQEALALYNRKDYAGAVDKYGQALIAYVRLGDQRKEALLSNDIGVIAYETGKYSSALGFYELALVAWRAVGDRSGEATTLLNMALANVALNELEKGISLYQQTASIRRAIGEGSGAAAALNGLGDIYYSRGEYTLALDAHSQALALQRDASDRAAQSQTLWSMALAAGALNRYDDALTFYEQALAIDRARNDSGRVRTDLSLIAAIYQFTGNQLKALEVYQELLALQRQVGDRGGEALALYSIALTYDGLGQTTKAIASYEQSLALYRALGGQPSQALVLGNLAFAHAGLGDYERAAEYMQQAVAVYHQTGDRSAEGQYLNSLGQIYMAQRQSTAALAAYEQALVIDQAVGATAEEGAVLFNIGTVHFQDGDYRTAIDYFMQSLPLHRQASIPARVWRTLNDLCIAYDALGDSAQALPLCRDSLAMQRQAGDASSLWLIVANTGYVLSRLGDLDAATSHYNEAMTIYEQTRAQAKQDFRSALAEQFVDVYANAANLAMQRGEAELAFNIAERARARSFLDQMGAAQVGGRGGDSQLVTQEQSLRAQLAGVEKSLRDELAKPQTQRQSGVTQYLANQAAARQREYGEMLALVRRSDPQYAELVSVDPLDLWEIQKLLDRNTTLLCYFLTVAKSYAFVVTSNSFHSVELPATYAEINAAVRDLYDFASLDQTPPSLAQLHAWLIAPVAQYLKTPVIGVIPHNVLHYVPFAALTDGQRYFGAEHTIFYLPNASALRFIAPKAHASNNLLALAQSRAEGLPPLHYAEDEAKAIADLYAVQPLLDSTATRSAFIERAPSAGIIHLAAHGQLNALSPLLSRLALAPDATSDGFLTVNDLYDLDLRNTDLVVLSACQTQLGALSRGDDVVGLTRAFIYAGSSSVIASLWSVDDQATSLLMTSFYKHLRQGMGKAAALRAAQADTRAHYPHPYYWAAFVLTGDAGQDRSSVSPKLPAVLLGSAGLVVAALALYSAKRKRGPAQTQSG
jgi:CHAT domain-containing protein/uncharacterized protein HemY